MSKCCVCVIIFPISSASGTVHWAMFIQLSVFQQTEWIKYKQKTELCVRGVWGKSIDKEEDDERSSLFSLTVYQQTTWPTCQGNVSSRDIPTRPPTGVSYAEQGEARPTRRGPLNKARPAQQGEARPTIRHHLPHSRLLIYYLLLPYYLHTT